MSAVTNTDILAISDDLLDCIGLNTKALDQRISRTLDKLDAKHLDAVAHVLGIATLIARRMAAERGKTEDEAQEREHQQNERIRALRSAYDAPFDHPPQRRLG